MSREASANVLRHLSQQNISLIESCNAEDDHTITSSFEPILILELGAQRVLLLKDPGSPSDRAVCRSFIEVCYLAEGAANALFRIQRHANVNLPSNKRFTEITFSYLLRMRKRDVPAFNPLTTFTHYQDIIEPLVDPAHLLKQYIVHIGVRKAQTLAEDDPVIQRLNQHLEQLESTDTSGTRPDRRRGGRLCGEYALLVEDASTDTSPLYGHIELKPKWLVQAPNAPTRATRCRTCAIRAKREVKDPQNAVIQYCPLGFLAPAPFNRQAILGAISPRLEEDQTYQRFSQAEQISLKSRLCRYFENGAGARLLKHLSHIQGSRDPDGVLGSTFASLQPHELKAAMEEVSTALSIVRLESTGWSQLPESDRYRGFSPAGAALLKLCQAMTFRDCSIIVRFPYHGEDEISSKLIDLDLKPPDKLEKWMAMERELVDEGWYFASDDEQCVLSRM